MAKGDRVTNLDLPEAPAMQEADIDQIILANPTEMKLEKRQKPLKRAFDYPLSSKYLAQDVDVRVEKCSG
jgi:hypothetical protein